MSPGSTRLFRAHAFRPKAIGSPSSHPRRLAFFHPLPSTLSSNVPPHVPLHPHTLSFLPHPFPSPTAAAAPRPRRGRSPTSFCDRPAGPSAPELATSSIRAPTATSRRASIESEGSHTRCAGRTASGRPNQAAGGWAPLRRPRPHRRPTPPPFSIPSPLALARCAHRAADSRRVRAALQTPLRGVLIDGAETYLERRQGRLRQRETVRPGAARRPCSVARVGRQRGARRPSLKRP